MNTLSTARIIHLECKLEECWCTGYENEWYVNLFRIAIDCWSVCLLRFLWQMLFLCWSMLYRWYTPFLDTTTLRKGWRLFSLRQAICLTIVSRLFSRRRRRRYFKVCRVYSSRSMRWHIFLVLNTEGLSRNSREENVKLRIFTSLSCSNGNWRNLHKSVMHVQSCCFAKMELEQERSRRLRKRQFKSVFALLQTLSRVFHHVQIRQMLANFCGVEF